MKEYEIDGLSLAEKDRIIEIIAAAKLSDWERFRFLTDRPFSNTSSMRVQFVDSSNIIKNLRKEPRIDTIIEEHQDGSRLIFAKIAPENSGDNAILLTIHSTTNNAQSIISIWTFYQEISFS